MRLNLHWVELRAYLNRVGFSVQLWRRRRDYCTGEWRLTFSYRGLTLWWHPLRLMRLPTR